ncbi:MAG: tyrosine-type recombinase/integrase [Microbacterium sp.]
MSQAGFSSQRAAIAARDEAREAAKIGPIVDRRQTVGGALDSWLDRKVRDGKLRASTERSYRQHLDSYLKPILGGVKLAELTADHLEHLLDEVRKMRPDMTAATLSRIYATARSFARTQYKRGRIPQDPTARMDGVTVARPRVKVWQPEEAGRFLAWLDARGEALAPVVQLAMFTGLRRGELAGLTWLDVDLDRARLVVRQQVVLVGAKLITQAPKTSAGEHRMVDLDADTIAMLRRHAEGQDVERRRLGDAWTETGAVFTAADGTPLSPERLTRGLPALIARYNAEQRVARLDDAQLAALAEELKPRRSAELAQHKTPALSAVVRRAVNDADYRANLAADATLGGTPLTVVKFHALRHLQASLMLAAGVPMAVVSKRLGHSSVAITSDTYSHLLDGVGAQAASAAAALIPRQSVPISTQNPRNGAD